MARLTKTVVEAATPANKKYTIWCTELKGFGVFVMPSGTRTYFVDYRNSDHVRRRMKIGRHGPITAEQARKLAIDVLAKVTRGEDPLEARNEQRSAMTVKELCERYIEDLEKGLILGKGGRPKKPGTVISDLGRINRHIIPLLGKKPVNRLTKADVTTMMKDIQSGKTRASVKTAKLRGRAVVRGGAGTASRSVGLLGGIITYARDDLGLILEFNPAHGIKKPKDNVRKRRLSEREFGVLGRILDEAARDERYERTAEMIRLIATTGCRRSEIIRLKWDEIDSEGSCLRLEDTKEGHSIRPIGLSVLERIDALQSAAVDSPYVFPGYDPNKPFGSFPRHWERIFSGTELEGLTAHVLRHSFASLGNDLGFTEITIAALIGHASGSMTGRYIHTVDVALVMAADSLGGYIDALMRGAKLKRSSYTLDRRARKAALIQFLNDNEDESRSLAA